MRQRGPAGRFRSGSRPSGRPERGRDDTPTGAQSTPAARELDRRGRRCAGMSRPGPGGTMPGPSNPLHERLSPRGILVWGVAGRGVPRGEGGEGARFTRPLMPAEPHVLPEGLPSSRLRASSVCLGKSRGQSGVPSSGAAFRSWLGSAAPSRRRVPKLRPEGEVSSSGA